MTPFSLHLLGSERSSFLVKKCKKWCLHSLFLTKPNCVSWRSYQCVGCNSFFKTLFENVLNLALSTCVFTCELLLHFVCWHTAPALPPPTVDQQNSVKQAGCVSRRPRAHIQYVHVPPCACAQLNEMVGHSYPTKGQKHHRVSSM